jgi:DnaJ family protein B protein 13
VGGYTFLGNSDEIFEKHFVESDPLSRDFEVEGTDVYGSLLGDGHKAKNEAAPCAPADIEIELGCTLKELFCGCLKTVKYTYSKIHANARTITQAEDETMVELKPGSRAGTVLTFSKKGNQQYMHQASNLRVKLVQVDDTVDVNTNKFMRRDNDLIYTHKMSLKDALASSPVKINTLDGRVSCVNMDVLITPQTVHRIVGEGMPIYEEGVLQPGQLTNHLKPFGQLPRGDLYVRFDIHFPEQLPAEKKAKIAALLQQAN